MGKDETDLLRQMWGKWDAEVDKRGVKERKEAFFTR
jgi:hypothetical protein